MSVQSSTFGKGPEFKKENTQPYPREKKGEMCQMPRPTFPTIWQKDKDTGMCQPPKIDLLKSGYDFLKDVFKR